MTIRALGPDDAAAFQALRLRGLADEPTAFASSHEEEVGLPLEEIARRLQPRDDRAIFGAYVAGAFETGALCGVIGVQRENMHKLRHKAYVWGMYVAPEARGTGRGRRLMQAALDHAWTVLQVRQVNLGVHTGNSAAMQLYQRCGFVVFGSERGALQVGGQLQDEHHMVCVRPDVAAA